MSSHGEGEGVEKEAATAAESTGNVDVIGVTISFLESRSAETGSDRSRAGSIGIGA